jgi:hypothetical protein
MEYSQELADAICELLAEGKSTRQICAAENMPSKSSVFKWKKEHPEFADQYARAKEDMLEHYADELVEIADDESNDKSGELEMPNSVAVQRARLRVDTRKWVLSKLAPKKYGDKLDMNLAGKDGGPIQSAIAVTFVRTNGGVE